MEEPRAVFLCHAARLCVREPLAALWNAGRCSDLYTELWLRARHGRRAVLHLRASRIAVGGYRQILARLRREHHQRQFRVTARRSDLCLGSLRVKLPVDLTERTGIRRKPVRVPWVRAVGSQLRAQQPDLQSGCWRPGPDLFRQQPQWRF